MSSILVAAENAPCTLNMSRLQRPPVGVEVRIGSQMSSLSLDHGSKLRGPSPKSLVSLQCNVNIHSLTTGIWR
ncbi:hypothetical protein TNCV_2891651 [Trichonephila clavipes]|nr:hypothetical protein TNCV_2891651 [Trichonephila clavipes]